MFNQAKSFLTRLADYWRIIHPSRADYPRWMQSCLWTTFLFLVGVWLAVGANFPTGFLSPNFFTTNAAPAILGTNQVNVVTNPANGMVLIGPSTPISTTASNAAQAVANNTSNALSGTIAASDNTTSNALTTALTAVIVANDAATSNALKTTIAASDNTTSNALTTALTAVIVANDAATSNALKTTIAANDNTTSNALTTALTAVIVANDAATSNALKTTIAANDNTTSNALTAALVAAQSGTAIDLSLSNTFSLPVSSASWSGTSLIADAQKLDVELISTNDISFGHATNGAALFSRSFSIYIYGGATNRSLIFPPGWTNQLWGCTQTNTILSNRWTAVFFRLRGDTSTSANQSNVWVKLEGQ